MDNSGNGPLRVPGFVEYPVNFQLPLEDRFAHGFNEYIQTPAITARELAMIDVMNVVTDKTKWHIDVFNEEITSRWGEDFKKEHQLIGNKAWAWCVAELKDKALEYKAKYFVRVVDAGPCACKSDELVPRTIDHSLSAALEPLRQTPTFDTVEPLRRPSASEIVDPYLFPLVYGTTKVLQEGGIVELEKSSEGGRLRFPSNSRPVGPRKDLGSLQHAIEGFSIDSTDRSRSNPDCTTNKLHSSQWSWKYQMLPCEVEFVGSDGNKVKITSYINNVHPSLVSVYEDMEKIISASIEPWNSCLIRGAIKINGQLDPSMEYTEVGHQVQRGRIPLRIITFGAVWKNELTLRAMSQNEEWKTKFKVYAWAKETVKTHPDKVIKFLGDKMQAKRIVRYWSWMDDLPPFPDQSEAGPVRRGDVTWKHPQPGQSFTYEDWKNGRNTDKAVVGMVFQSPRSDRNLRGPTHERYEVNLAETYRSKGLQVIVRVSSIDLQSHGSDHTGSWQLGGLLNEHIVATSIYPFDVSNASSRISFRQESPMPFYVYRYENGSGPSMCQFDDPSDIRFRDNDHCTEIEALAEVFGFESMINIDGCLHETVIRLREIGHVDLPQGRLITFPNTIEHRLEISLLDKSLPGHFRYVHLYLVDPNYRICSTKNVPPQRADWQSDIESNVESLLMADGPPMRMKQAIGYKKDWLIGQDRARSKRYSHVGEYYF